MSAPALRLENVSKAFQDPRRKIDVTAIGSVSLEVASGEFVAIVGPSGCGKTTLLRIIAGLISHTSGRVERRARQDQIAMVFQSANLMPWRTALKNVEYPLELKVRRAQLAHKAERRDRAMKMLELVELHANADYYPDALSGGMQQRVNLARALAISPELLLMDEPFGALDAQTREELQVELQRISVETASTCVFITHDTREAVFLADKVIVLSSAPSLVAEVVEIPEPRPRTLDFQVSDQFTELHKRVWDAVRGGTPRGTGPRAGRVGDLAAARSLARADLNLEPASGASVHDQATQRRIKGFGQ